ncbi:unnamed protein product [Ixodes persulcatus]
MNLQLKVTVSIRDNLYEHQNAITRWSKPEGHKLFGPPTTKNNLAASGNPLSNHFWASFGSSLRPCNLHFMHLNKECWQNNPRSSSHSDHSTKETTTRLADKRRSSFGNGSSSVIYRRKTDYHILIRKSVVQDYNV